ncbi:hypothetical protein F5880DRAFT_1503922 [Lentinula raphanica]|nr:hypothetical protein F5880DRAFT_1503922 [Lentinula raphanica]
MLIPLFIVTSTIILNATSVHVASIHFVRDKPIGVVELEHDWPRNPSMFFERLDVTLGLGHRQSESLPESTGLQEHSAKQTSTLEQQGQRHTLRESERLEGDSNEELLLTAGLLSQPSEYKSQVTLRFTLLHHVRASFSAVRMNGGRSIRNWSGQFYFPMMVQADPNLGDLRRFGPRFAALPHLPLSGITSLGYLKRILDGPISYGSSSNVCQGVGPQRGTHWVHPVAVVRLPCSARFHTPALSLAPAPPTGALQADPQIPANSGIQHESNVLAPSSQHDRTLAHKLLSVQIGGHQIAKQWTRASLLEEAAQYKEGAKSARQQAKDSLTWKHEQDTETESHEQSIRNLKDMKRRIDEDLTKPPEQRWLPGLTDEDLVQKRKDFEELIKKHNKSVEEYRASASAASAESDRYEAKAQDLENQARYSLQRSDHGTVDSRSGLRSNDEVRVLEPGVFGILCPSDLLKYRGEFPNLLPHVKTD